MPLPYFLFLNMKFFTRILHILLVALSFLSGMIKVIGVRIEFMKITHIGFDDWKITLFGVAQVLSALLLAIPKTIIIGAAAYSLTYVYVARQYFAYDQSPKFLPVLLCVLPIILIFLKRKTNQT